MHGGISASYGATPEDLNRCIRDLVALSTLPAVWLGSEAVRVAESLAAALFATLRPDLVYLGLEAVESNAPLRVAQTGRYSTDPALARELGPRILEWARTHDPDELMPVDRAEGRRLWLATRTLGFNATLGVIAAGFEDPASITPFQYTLLSVGATQAASAVQNAQLLSDLRRNVRERAQAEQALRDELELQERLKEFGHALAEQGDIDSTVSVIAQCAMALTGAEAAVYATTGDARGRPPQFDATVFIDSGKCSHWDGRDAAMLWPIVESAGTGIINLGDVADSGVPPQCAALASKMPFRSCLASPVGNGDGTKSLLVLTHRKPQFFHSRAERVLSSIATQAAVALENARLQQQRLELIERLRIADRAKDHLLAHLRAVVETTPACIKLVAADGTVLDMNSAGLAMVEANALEEVKGRCVYDLVSDEYRAAFRALNERVCSGAHETMQFEVVGLRGTRRYMETYAAPLRGPDGNYVQLAITVDVTSRKQTEQELRRQAQVLESMVEGVSVADETGVIVYTNPAEDRIFGYARGELVGQNVSVQNDYPEDENRRIVTEVIERLKREKSWSGEFSNRRKDGSKFTTFARISALDIGGRRYFVCVQEDITDRKLAENALADARARLDAALEAGAIATWTWDIQQNRLFADRMLARLFNLPPSHADGGPLDEYARSIHPEDLPQVMHALEHAVASGRDYRAEYRVVQADGTVRWVVASGRAERDGTGRATRMPGVLVDITERKALEEQLRVRLDQLADADRRKEELLASLRESEEKLRLLADTIPQLAWMAHPNGEIYWYNRRWYEYTGTTPEQVAGWNWQSVHDPEVLPAVLERWKTSLSTGEPFDMVFPLRGADGRFRPFLTRVNPLRSGDGRILHWFGTNTDISDIKRMEEALRDADRRKDEFLATLAHELRNPLAPIRNSLEILKMPRLDPAVARQAVGMMGRQVQSLVRLVDDLLDVARVMRNKIELRKEPLQVATVVARAVEMVQSQIDAHAHRLELSVPEESLIVHADPVRLAQVIGNLLSNSAKYTESMGHISLAVLRSGPDVLFRVKDDGIGIAKDVLPHIFELFVQADHAFARAHGGLGIGLTLVKNLVEMHGGTVHAHSAGVGKGSEFTVRLPLEGASEAEQPAPDVEQLPTVYAPGHRLLVVDDNVDAARSLAMLLRLHGHDVAVAHDGRSALETAEAFRPRAVFLDIGMPGMDGYEVARLMRHQCNLNGVVLVALSGWGQAEDRRRTAAAGFHHHLIKPAEPAALGHVLAQLQDSSAGR
jgi:PAS domain S-box-containing protein